MSASPIDSPMAQGSAPVPVEQMPTNEAIAQLLQSIKTANGSSQVPDIVERLNVLMTARVVEERRMGFQEGKAAGDGEKAEVEQLLATKQLENDRKIVELEKMILAKEKESLQLQNNFLAAQNTNTTIPDGTPPVSVRIPTRKASELKKPHRYDGTVTNEAATKWLSHCRSYWKTEGIFLGAQALDIQKVALASTWLEGKAAERWNAEAQLSEKNPHAYPMPVTWIGFEAWITERFRELNAEENRWERLTAIRQKSDIQSYVAEMDQAYFELGYELPEEARTQMVLHGLRPEIQAEWHMVQDKPRNLAGMVKVLTNIEQSVGTAKKSTGAKRKNHAPQHTDPDAMDLSALDGGLSEREVEEINAMISTPKAPRKDSWAWKPWCRRNKACFECGSKKHGAAKCPDRKKRTNGSRSGDRSGNKSDSKNEKSQ